MRRKNNRTITFTLIFYILAIITVILNQLFIRNDSVILKEVNFYSIFLMTISLSVFIMNHFLFISITKQRISINVIVNIEIKTFLYYLINIMIVNKLVLNASTIIFITLILTLSIIDIVVLIINFRKVNILILNNDEEILKQEKDYKVKTIENSEDFKSFQLNIFLLLISIFSIYLVNVFIDYKNGVQIIIFGTVLLCSLILSIKYVQNIKKISEEIRFYHYLSVILTILTTSLILYYKVNLLIFVVAIILIPILKIDLDVRRTLLNENSSKE